ncbi:MAG: DUF1338 domain-containing protein [Bacteroidetes bacterium]|nr:DUF1338 domain-containing protein [Bacteroidota bacterium]
MTSIDQLFGELWADYSTRNPIANQIHHLLESKGETVVNDHVALRTFNVHPVGIEALAKPFVRLGYTEKGQYQFPEKKLFARHWEHPSGLYPRVFISELLVEEFSQDFQKIIELLVKQVPAETVKSPGFPVAGIPWTIIDFETYEFLRQESEYAAWMAVNGFRANHFTVSVNHLNSFPSLDSLNRFLKESGFRLNSQGGEIKGTPAEFLEQSSTLANMIRIELADGTYDLPGCYYEFALRHPMATGELYSGFIASSADKIFESTDRKIQ